MGRAQRPTVLVLATAPTKGLAELIADSLAEPDDRHHLLVVPSLRRSRSSTPLRWDVRALPGTPGHVLDAALARLRDRSA